MTDKYVSKLKNDMEYRMKFMLYGASLWNAVYGVFQYFLGRYHGSFWFYSMAAYYLSLAAMRVYLAFHTRRHALREDIRKEYKKYRVCGFVFLLMNMALTAMIFFMVYFNRSFHHHKITTIAMAAYTFTSFTFCIINLIKARRLESPLFSAAKVISFAAACVSMLTLESTMLTTFGEEMEASAIKLMLGLTGGAVSAFIITMAVYMIVHSSKKLRENGENNER